MTLCLQLHSDMLIYWRWPVKLKRYAIASSKHESKNSTNNGANILRRCPSG
uniref:Uncharacterized protein n=1 Tax=Rhizophora mucronata TaxID=61149 RepID=A0A2P2QHW8_RHIMU